MSGAMLIQTEGWQVALLALLSLAIATWAYRRRSLSASGAVTAFIVATVMAAAGGAVYFAALMAFFLSSTAITKIGHEKKEEVEKLYPRNDVRDHVQVLANGGAAFIISLLSFFLKEKALVTALFSSLAAANADTWASEIGVLSKKLPVSILTWKPVKKGLSGGVTILGFAASLAGSVFMALLYLAIASKWSSFSSPFVDMGVIVLAGLFGSLLDSILGDACQAKYADAATGELTEKPSRAGVANRLVRGLSFIDNDLVNFLTSGLSGLLAFLLASAI